MAYIEEKKGTLYTAKVVRIQLNHFILKSEYFLKRQLPYFVTCFAPGPSLMPRLLLNKISDYASYLTRHFISIKCVFVQRSVGK